MLGRVLLVLLAGIPVCWGAEGASYSAYYDPDGSNENADFYDSYNDEIRQPPERTTVMEGLTRMKRNDLEDIRTLNPEEIVDVKGVLNNILQGKNPESPKQLPARESTDSYEYLENSNNLGINERRTDFKEWLHTAVRQEWSPSVNNQDNTVETTTQVTEQQWSFMYQTETSTYSKDDIVAEVRRMMPEGVVPKQSSIGVPYWSPKTEAKTVATTENTEETEHTIDIYPQETSTYSNSHMQAEVNKLVQDWRPTGHVIDLYPQETTTYSNSDMQANVNKLVKHWSPKDKQETPHNDAVMRAEVSSPVQHWSPSDKQETPYDDAAMRAEVRSLVQNWSPSGEQETPYDDAAMRAEVRSLVQHWSPSGEQDTTYNDAAMRAEVRSLVQHWSPSTPSNIPRSDTSKVQHWSRSEAKAPVSEKHQQISGMYSGVDTMETGSHTNDLHHQESSQSVQHFSTSDNPQQWNPSDIVRFRDPFANVQLREPSDNVQTTETLKETTSTHPDTQTTDKELVVTTGAGVENQSATTVQLWSTNVDAQNDGETSTLDTGNFTDVKLQKAVREASQPMDIDAIMAIISNLTYDYEWNLTEMFNKTIIDHGVPTCPWKGGGKWGPGGIWTAVTVNLTTLHPRDFENSSVVSKCFVCGLKTPEIPRNAYCADAFAGDFLPLMPIDARSRSMIANYRKYCRYMDVQNFLDNPEEPRSIYGRFTGGCAVRWTDITGVYTQRTCRSRYRPLLGKHFASKRMAKLELALVNVDNGCIISPMATLLPVSRGISLYARFHACVCSTNWCNRAVLDQTSSTTVVTILLAHWLATYS